MTLLKTIKTSSCCENLFFSFLSALTPSALKKPSALTPNHVEAFISVFLVTTAIENKKKRIRNLYSIGLFTRHRTCQN